MKYAKYVSLFFLSLFCISTVFADKKNDCMALANTTWQGKFKVTLGDVPMTLMIDDVTPDPNNEKTYNIAGRVLASDHQYWLVAPASRCILTPAQDAIEEISLNFMMDGPQMGMSQFHFTQPAVHPHTLIMDGNFWIYRFNTINSGFLYKN